MIITIHYNTHINSCMMIRRHTTHNMIKFETLLSKKIECKMSNSSFCWKLFEKKNSKWTSSSNTTTIVIIIAFYMLLAKLNTNSDLCALSLFNTTFFTALRSVVCWQVLLRRKKWSEWEQWSGEYSKKEDEREHVSSRRWR